MRFRAHPIITMPCLLWLVFWQVLRAEPMPDIASTAPDLTVPAVVHGPPVAGKRVRLALFPDTPPVVLYLPTDWAPEKKFPVLVELAGNGNYKNAFGDVSNGVPEGSNLGYGLSGGQGFIWACLPFLNETGFRNHNDAWVLRPSTARGIAREWLMRVATEPTGG